MSKINNKTSTSLKILKTITIITKLLSFISAKLLMMFATKLFIAPIKF